MKFGYTLLLGLAAATMVAGHASAVVLYDNGAPQGSNAYAIDSDSWITNSFTLTSDALVTGISFSVENSLRIPLQSIGWGISTDRDFAHNMTSAVSGGVVGHTPWGWPVDTYSFSVANLSLTAGTTYYLTLVAPVSGYYWDVSGGPSETFVQSTNGNGGLELSNAFQIMGDPIAASPTPEPASWMMMIGGFGAIGGAMRHRRRTMVRAI